MLSYLGPHREPTRVLPITILVCMMLMNIESDVCLTYFINPTNNNSNLYSSKVLLHFSFIKKYGEIEWCISLALCCKGVVQ